MTIDGAIKHCLEVAEKNDGEAEVYDLLAKNHNNPYEKLTASRFHADCAECAVDHRQLAEWLTELKDLREENKVLTSECDRLIKEKGELLSKVGGGDVLRICQLEEQIKDWKEEYANLNKISYGFYEELKEAKRLLKAAVEDLEKIASVDECSFPYCDNRCPFGCVGQCEEKHWKHKDEALKLIES